MFKCSNVQIFKCSNVQMFNCSNAQILKCSNVNKVKILSERTSGVPTVIFYHHTRQQGVTFSDLVLKLQLVMTCRLCKKIILALIILLSTVLPNAGKIDQEVDSTFYKFFLIKTNRKYWESLAGPEQTQTPIL